MNQDEASNPRVRLEATAAVCLGACRVHAASTDREMVVAEDSRAS